MDDGINYSLLSTGMDDCSWEESFS